MSAPIVPKSDEEIHDFHDRLIAGHRADSRWFEEARFGLFIHFGLYSEHAGVWKGEAVPGLGEWLMYRKRIPLAEYRELAERFRPNLFDADDICRRAAAAGMRYAVFTAKHHDGFALFHSKISKYNIVDCGFGRDLVREFVDACRKHGLTPGLYYSHMIDWEDPDAVGPQGNDWDFDPSTGNLDAYFERKAFPQVEELLTNYGELGVLWFDMPRGLLPHLAARMRSLVRRIQPQILVNSRLGGPDYDIFCTDDNYVSVTQMDNVWEMPATMNGSWGYKSEQSEWRPFSANLYSLLDTASKGGNLLLNIGPAGDGTVPAASLDLLDQFSGWFQDYGTTLQGTARTPFPWAQPWGFVTAKDKFLYLNLMQNEGASVPLPGLLSPVREAHLLGARAKENLSVRSLMTDGVAIEIPPDLSLPAAIELHLTEAPRISAISPQWPDGVIRLDRRMAFETEKASYEWGFLLSAPGRFKVTFFSIEAGGHHAPQWSGEGLQGVINVRDEMLKFIVKGDQRRYYQVLHFWHEIVSEIGEIELKTAGQNILRLSGIIIDNSKWATSGLNLMAIHLTPLLTVSDGY